MPTQSESPVTPQIGVSVIMTVLNEERHLAETVVAVLGQDWQGPLELVIALGPSTDRTPAIAAEFEAADARVKTVANPSGRTPAGLNAALALAEFDIVIRVDGHCLLPVEYVSTAVAVLNQTGADNVGGVMAAVGETVFERAVACAMTSRLGVGAASFHVGGEAGPAPTVYLGAFRRSALERVGGYDETFERAQDWEMNHRIRESGGIVWFTPALQVSYRPRANAKALARQYLHYGRWRREVMRNHSGTVELRYLVAPAAVAAMAAGAIAGLAAATLSDALPAARLGRVGWLIPAGYAVAVVVGGAAISRDEPLAVRARVPGVLATMHCAWGIGFLTSPSTLRS